MTTYVGISHSAKLPTTAAETIDDVEDLLSKFIPPGIFTLCLVIIQTCADVFCYAIGYLTALSEFEAAVEADARTFRPPGERIHAYTRVLRDIHEKGKEREVEEQEVEFEVYHVRILIYSYPTGLSHWT